MTLAVVAKPRASFGRSHPDQPRVQHRSLPVLDRFAIDGDHGSSPQRQRQKGTQR